jgi:hypothetical protein
MHMLPHPVGPLCTQLNTPSFTATNMGLYLLLQGTGRGPRITGWYEDVSVYTLIYNLMPVNKMLPSVKLHDYVELALGKVGEAAFGPCSNSVRSSGDWGSGWEGGGRRQPSSSHTVAHVCVSVLNCMPCACVPGGRAV